MFAQPRLIGVALEQAGGDGGLALLVKKKGSALMTLPSAAATGRAAMVSKIARQKNKRRMEGR
jgi:hypothetical protein